MPTYDETGEELHQVKVLNDVDQQQGEAFMATDKQIDELVAQLPDG